MPPRLPSVLLLVLTLLSSCGGGSSDGLSTNSAGTGVASSTSNGVTTFNLSLAASSKQILTGAKTATYGYNGSDFWGPTLILTKGTQSRMVLQNNLAEATTTHWHGLLVSGAVDGGPHQMIAPGATWTTPAFTVKNQAATYWYHPHLHGATQRHLTLGAGGLIIVKDADEAALALPRSYGVDDIPLIITSCRARSYGCGCSMPRLSASTTWALVTTALSM